MPEDQALRQRLQPGQPSCTQCRKAHLIKRSEVYQLRGPLWRPR